MLLEIQKKIRQMKVTKMINRLPITIKVTVWYTTFLLILLTMLVVVSFLVSNSYAVSMSEQDLKKAVNDIVTGEEAYEPYDEGVLLLFYDADGNLQDGKAPDSFNIEPTFSESVVREYSNGESQYIYYDSQISAGKYQGDWIRGIISVNGLKHKLSMISIALLVICPMILIIISLGGYMIIKLAFKPVKRISKTAIEIGNNYDLTKRIKLEEGNDEIHQMAYAFNEMLDSLEEASLHEKQFTTDVSHELRTPISVILAESQYGENHIESLEEAKNSFQIISRQSKRMSKLVNQLLEISRMDRTMEVEKIEFNLSETLRSMSVDYRSLAEANELSLIERIEGDIFIYGNKMMVQRVFDNLFTNALKFTSTQIIISLRENQQFGYLSVEDDGPGIAEENQNRIWERFYQVDYSRNKESNTGFGLGLAMVKKIMQIHDGDANVKTKQNGGSIFTVSFPIVKS